MGTLSPEEEKQKKAIFDSMSARGKKYVSKIGYENWDPFQKPKDPIDIRKDPTRRTARQLARDFLSAWEHEDYSNAFGQGVWEMCLGIIGEDERYRGMYEFSCWYRDLRKKEGLT